jgi:hypothetical protein
MRWPGWAGPCRTVRTRADRGLTRERRGPLRRTSTILQDSAVCLGTAALSPRSHHSGPAGTSAPPHPARSYEVLTVPY